MALMYAYVAVGYVVSFGILCGFFSVSVAYVRMFWLFRTFVFLKSLLRQIMLPQGS